MKAKLLLASCCLIYFTYSPAICQGLSDSTEIEQSIWRMKQKRMIVDYMNLSEADKACFWPMYDSYENSIEYIEHESVEILSVFAHAGGELNPRQIEKFSRQLMQNDLWLAHIRKKFQRKLSKALSPQIAMRFLEIDDAMRQMHRLEARAGNYSEVALQASSK